MVSEQGALHFYKIDGEKGVRGNLLDNANLLLAFIEGYEILKDERYLETAKKIADFSLENLYDWNSGGFFERNSPDKELYALGENINLKKPGEENGIMAFAMLKLYSQTNDVRYLNAGLKTLGAMLSNSGGLDSGYYYAKSAEFVLENDLLGDYEKSKEKINVLEKVAQKDFWLNDLLDSNLDVGVITGSEVEVTSSTFTVLITSRAELPAVSVAL